MAARLRLLLVLIYCGQLDKVIHFQQLSSCLSLLQCDKPQLEDGNTIGPKRETIESSLGEMGYQWEEHLKRCRFVDALRPSLFLDHLRAFQLLSRNEQEELQQLSETERSVRLIGTILPQKGKGSFEKFCNILCFVENQSHIVSEILKVQSIPLPVVHASFQLNENKIDQSLSFVPLKKKRLKEGSSDLESISIQAKPSYDCSATFVFRKEDQKKVKCWEQSICDMCRQCFNILQENVKFLYSFPPADQLDPTFFADLHHKLVVIQLNGVAPDLVQKHKAQLDSHIAFFMGVSEDRFLYAGVAQGSSFVLFQMQLDTYFRLFTALTVEAQCMSFYRMLKQTFPELAVAKFRLGGLPPIEVINSGVSMEKVLMGKGEFSVIVCVFICVCVFVHTYMDACTCV